MSFPKKLVLGGQTGVDRAALDAAKMKIEPCIYICQVLTYVNRLPILILNQHGRQQMRPEHKIKEIEQAIQYAVTHGWRYKSAGKSAHAWGFLLCKQEDRGGCRMSIWGTPTNPYNHARQIIRNVDSCPHYATGDS